MRVTQDMLREGLRVYHVMAFPAKLPREYSNGYIEVKTYIKPHVWDHDPTAQFASFHVTHSLKREAWWTPHGERVFGEWRLLDRDYLEKTNSLEDMGIIPNRYNHHQTFTSMQAAWNYLAAVCELKCPTPPEVETVRDYDDKEEVGRERAE